MNKVYMNEVYMNKVELKPCPFCGKTVNDIWIFEYCVNKWVLNHYCARNDKDNLTVCVSVYGDTKEEIINIWNRRIDNEQRKAD